MSDFAFRGGSKPRLLTAIKHEGKIIKGRQGEAHPKLAERSGVYEKDARQELYDRRQAGNEVEGFINHKGHFLDRDKAREYAREHNLIKPDKYGEEPIGVKYALHGFHIKENDV